MKGEKHPYCQSRESQEGDLHFFFYALKDKMELPEEAERKKGPVFAGLCWALFQTYKFFGTVTAFLCSTE